MKYLLMIYMNPATWEALSEDERTEVFRGHDELAKILTESGEMISGEALADPESTTTVRIRGGTQAVTDGPYLAAKEYLAGYYLVDCESRERAIELAGLIPDARYTAVEVRALLSPGGVEM
jgi:hypothetical protein